MVIQQAANLTRTGRARRPVTVDPRNPDNLSAVQRARRDEIVRQALRMLERYDFDDIQMRDVAIRSDVALGTVYRYFASKDHLFAAALLEWGRAFEPRLAADPLRGATGVERLRDLVSRIMEAFDRRPQVLRLMSVLQTSTDPLGRQLYLEFSEITREIMEAPIAEFDPERAPAVARTLRLVLGGAFRGRGSGACTSEQARQWVNEAIDLIYPPDSPHNVPKASG